MAELIDLKKELHEAFEIVKLNPVEIHHFAHEKSAALKIGWLIFTGSVLAYFLGEWLFFLKILILQ